eukprot:TRINITY_DN24484_c0_g1_i2.p1 TRINITY_DN24484_c0_g1~~TRINITY_DN24484_c0_g1_i2.p1  ORF type:complete len:528 (+),score=124.84 TRINITY_DN24484_c0_g1_i2:306-1889(+)
MTGLFSLRQQCYVGLPSPKLEEVRAYFGEEVAFFFLWLSHYSRSLRAVALVSVLLLLRKAAILDVPLRYRRYMQIGYSVLILLWGTVFLARQKSNQLQRMDQWGMTQWKNRSPTLPSFELSVRGTWRESRRRGLHWLMISAFLVEVVIVTSYITTLREDAWREPAGRSYGIENATWIQCGKYLITLNISLMAKLWDYISPNLSQGENHRTRAHLKAATAQKLFFVKAIVSYYPFLYIAFFKPLILGVDCKRVFATSSEDFDPRQACLPELKENLMIFFLTHLGTQAATIIYQIVQIRLMIWGEVAKGKRSGNRRYTYLDFQSKCVEFGNDTEDIIELIMCLGFVMMFSVVLPIMSFIALTYNLIVIRLFLWRLCFVNRRPMPNLVPDGLGIWNEVMDVLLNLAVVSNGTLAVFVMHPFADMAMERKLFIFIVAQSAMFSLKYVIMQVVAGRRLGHIRTEEVNEQAVTDILGHDREFITLRMKTTEPPRLGLTVAEHLEDPSIETGGSKWRKEKKVFVERLASSLWSM